MDNAGFGTASLTSPEEILAHEITVFRDYIRIDVQTSTPGITFDEAWPRRNTMEFQGQPMLVISKGDLIVSKRASSREVDLEDVRLLELYDTE